MPAHPGHSSVAEQVTHPGALSNAIFLSRGRPGNFPFAWSVIAGVTEGEAYEGVGRLH